MQSSLEHHLLQISVAKQTPEAPAHTEQNNLGLEVTPFERGDGIYAIVSSQFSKYCRAYYILVVFATQPHDVMSSLAEGRDLGLVSNTSCSSDTHAQMSTST